MLNSLAKMLNYTFEKCYASLATGTKLLCFDVCDVSLEAVKSNTDQSLVLLRIDFQLKLIIFDFKCGCPLSCNF